MFSFFKEEVSIALLTKFINLSLLKGFSKNSNAPSFIESTAILIFACPDIIITGTSVSTDLINFNTSIPSLFFSSNKTSNMTRSGNFFLISDRAFSTVSASRTKKLLSFKISCTANLISFSSSISKISLFIN